MAADVYPARPEPYWGRGLAGWLPADSANRSRGARRSATNCSRRPGPLSLTRCLRRSRRSRQSSDLPRYSPEAPSCSPSASVIVREAPRLPLLLSVFLISPFPIIEGATEANSPQRHRVTEKAGYGWAARRDGSEPHGKRCSLVYQITQSLLCVSVTLW